MKPSVHEAHRLVSRPFPLRLCYVCWRLRLQRRGVLSACRARQMNLFDPHPRTARGASPVRQAHQARRGGSSASCAAAAPPTWLSSARRAAGVGVARWHSQPCSTWECTPRARGARHAGRGGRPGRGGAEALSLAPAASRRATAGAPHVRPGPSPALRTCPPPLQSRAGSLRGRATLQELRTCGRPSARASPLQSRAGPRRRPGFFQRLKNKERHSRRLASAAGSPRPAARAFPVGSRAGPRADFIHQHPAVRLNQGVRADIQQRWISCCPSYVCSAPTPPG